MNLILLICLMCGQLLRQASLNQLLALSTYYEICANGIWFNIKVGCVVEAGNYGITLDTDLLFRKLINTSTESSFSNLRRIFSRTDILSKCKIKLDMNFVNICLLLLG